MENRRSYLVQIVFAILLGVFVGRYGPLNLNAIPEYFRHDLRQTLTLFSSSVSQRTLLESVFTDPTQETSFYYRPITSLTELYERNSDLAIDASLFDRAYTNIQIIEASAIKRMPEELPVISVRFKLNGTEKQAFAYGIYPTRCEKSTGKAALIIPGSGVNQSIAIFSGEKNNYQGGLLGVFQRNNLSSFVLIKPNESYLAWHNGQGEKVNEATIFNWQLNRRSSYSAAYIVQAMALMKWMKWCFGHTVLAGVSQGGSAVLLAGLQAEPSMAIVASGFSLLADSIDSSGQNQIAGVPLFGDLHRPEVISSRLKASRTLWVFSWGIYEQDIYGLEARQLATARTIGNIENVLWRSVKQDHSAPVGLVDSLIKSKKIFR